MKKYLWLFFLVCFVFSPLQLFADVPIFFGEEVIVTAARYLQPLSKTFQKSRVITQDEIKKSGALTVADVLNLIPTVKVKNTGWLGGIGSIRMKSAASSQVLVLLDGERINSTLLGMFDLNDVQISDVDRIEIVEDSLSTIYGSDAIGGVVNVITKDRSKDLINAEIAYGSYNTLLFNISHGGTISNLKYGISYQNIKTDGFRQNSDYKNNSLSFYSNWDNNIILKYNQINSERGNPSVPPSDFDKWAASTPLDRQKDLYTNYGIEVNSNFLAFNKLVISETYQNEDVHYFDTFTWAFVDDNYKSKLTALSLQNFKSFPNSSLLYLTELKRSYGKSSKAGEHFVDDLSIAANLQSNPDLPLAASYSLRYDDSKVWGSQIIPSVTMMLSLSEYGRLRYSFAKSFRAPTINELYWNEPSWGMFGNPALRPEKGDSFSVYFDNKIFGADLNLGYYKNSITDMISWVQTAPWIWQTKNISSSKIEGINVGIKREILKGINFFIDYNSENVLDLSTDKIIPYSPSYKINSGIELSTKDLSINLKAKDVSSVYTNSTNTKSLPAYRVVDFVLIKKISDIVLTASIMNIFDENYYESVGISSVDWQERGYPMPGRRFEIKMSY